MNAEAIAADALKITSTLNLSSEELPVTLGIDTVWLKDAAARRMRADTTLSVMNYMLANVQLYGEADTLMVGLPDFFGQNLVFETKRIDKQYNQSLLAKVFGEADLPELSLDLFPAQKPSLEAALSAWEDFLEHWKEIRESGESLPAIQVEKLQKDVEIKMDEGSGAKYRCSQYLVTIPKAWAERLFADEENVEVEQDIILLVAMDRNNHIICLSFEEPLSLLVKTSEGKHTVEIRADMSFLGEKRSIDDVIAELKVDVPLELLAEMAGLEKSLSLYQDESLAKDSRMKINIGTEVRFDENNMRYVMEPNRLEISLGQYFAFKVAGSVMLEPLHERIQPMEGKTIRLFAMTEAEYQDLEEQLQRKLRKWAAAYGKNWWK